MCLFYLLSPWQESSHGRHAFVCQVRKAYLMAEIHDYPLIFHSIGLLLTTLKGDLYLLFFYCTILRGWNFASQKNLSWVTIIEALKSIEVTCCPIILSCLVVLPYLHTVSRKEKYRESLRYVWGNNDATVPKDSF